jgi:hypothetical protein
MSILLPPALVAFFHAHNSGDTREFMSLFSADARVRDEGHEYQGPAIRAWLDGAIAQYQPQAAVDGVVSEDARLTVTAQVSGNFPGSPVQLRYAFTLRDGLIADLFIGP